MHSYQYLVVLRSRFLDVSELKNFRWSVLRDDNRLQRCSSKVALGRATLSTGHQDASYKPAKPNGPRITRERQGVARGVLVGAERKPPLQTP